MVVVGGPPAAKAFAGCAMKRAVNAFVADEVRGADSPAVVLIDASELGSTRAVLGASPDARVVTMNFDPEVAEAATRLGAAGVSGCSTSSFDKLQERPRFWGEGRIAYMDYCGTPGGCESIGFFPAVDMGHIARFLAPGRVAVVTHSRRNAGRCAYEVAEANFAGAGLAVLWRQPYCETSPMVVYLVCHQTDVASRGARSSRRNFARAVQTALK